MGQLHRVLVVKPGELPDVEVVVGQPRRENVAGGEVAKPRMRVALSPVDVAETGEPNERSSALAREIV